MSTIVPHQYRQSLQYAEIKLRATSAMGAAHNRSHSMQKYLHRRRVAASFWISDPFIVPRFPPLYALDQD